MSTLCAGKLMAAACLIWALAMGPSGVATAGAIESEPVVIHRAQFLLAPDESPPPAGRPWVGLKLPDSWSESRRAAEGIGWYLMTFDVPAPAGRPLAVLIGRLSMNGEIFVNGVRLLSGGRMQPPVTRNWNTPFFVEIPAPLLHAGRNELQVRVFAYRNNNGGLGLVQVGPSDSLRQRHSRMQAVQVEGSVISFAVALVAAFIGIAGWWRLGRDPVFGLFGLAMACWVVRYTNYFMQNVPFDHVVWSLAVNSAQGWFFVFFAPFLLRLAGLHWPGVGRALLALGLAGTVAIWAAFNGLVPLKLVIGIWSFVWLPGSLALLAVSARLAWQERSAGSALAALAVWLYVPLTLRELLVTSNVLPFDTSYIAHYVGIPLALLMSWLLIERAVAAGRRAAEAELARAHAAFEERQRLTQDMHDGLGLQLNSALRVVERGQLVRSEFVDMLRGCLDELRLIVDSTTADGGDFLPLLANLRIRLQPRLEAAGLRVNWRLDGFPPQLRLAPDASLQLLRIVQEAINNTVKHAGARTIEFSVVAGDSPGRVALEVRDDGSGFAPGAPAAGKGLTGMRRRAAKAGVELEIQSTGGGTCVRIQLPETVMTVPTAPAAPR